MTYTPPDSFGIRLGYIKEDFTGDGVAATVTLAYDPVADSEMVFVNGLYQRKGATDDYTISGKVITFTFTPQTYDEIDVEYVRY
jgi:hypothetical protein